MKKENRRVIAFITALALVFTTFFSMGVSFAAETATAEPLITPAPMSAFSDIAGHWGEAAINQAVTNGFVKGYADGTFKPNQSVTRAEFVTMVNKALQLKDDNTVNLLFKDVKATDWFYKDIQKASYARYVSGISDTSFMPAKNITRQEAASMLARFLPKVGFEPTAVVSTFPDAATVSSWAKPSMAVALNKEYITGYANGRLMPIASLTRAEAATIIGKILKKETIVRDDTFVANSADVLRDKIYVGDITIQKTVGDGDATLENLSALSKVYVLGGGVNTVTLKNTLIIQLIISKEGTKVRVLSDGGTIYETFVFNGNLLVDDSGAGAELGEGGFENIIYIEGTVSADDARQIALEIASRIDSSGKVTEQQAGLGAAEILTGSTADVNPDGSIVITVQNPIIPHKHTTAPEEEEEAGICGHTVAEGGFTETVLLDDGVTTAYAIYTEKQLQHLAMHLDANAKLMNDLDFSDIATGAGIDTPMYALSQAGIDTEYYVFEEQDNYFDGCTIDYFSEGNFVPIGDDEFSDLPYTGIFNGNGKTIEGLIISGIEEYIDGDTEETILSPIDGVAMFGYTDEATIQDLTIKDSSVTGGDEVGSIVGWAYDTTIQGITINGNSITGFDNIGGIVGEEDDSTIQEITIEAITVTGKYEWDDYDDYFYGGESVGSIVGNSEDSTIEGITINGATVTGFGCVGGIVGEDDGSTIQGITIEAITVTGEYEWDDNYDEYDGGYDIGGIVGDSYESIIQDITINDGTLTGLYNIGGIVGYDDNSTIQDITIEDITVTGERVWNEEDYDYEGADVGGIVGDSEDSIIKDITINGGTVTGFDNVGGFVGNAEGLMISLSEYEYNSNDASVTGDNYVGGIVGYNLYSDVYSTNNTATISGQFAVGGIVGFNATDYSYYYQGDGYYEFDNDPGSIEISNCTNDGDINTPTQSAFEEYADPYSETTADAIGGIVGYNQLYGDYYYDEGDDYSEGIINITNCTNNGDITAARTEGQELVGMGGIVGYSYSESYDGYYGEGDGYIDISGCTNTGDVTASNGYYSYGIGGIAGYVDVDYGSIVISQSINAGDITGGGDVGGVVGSNVYGTVEGSYNTGIIMGTGEMDISDGYYYGVGGVAGSNESGMIKDSYNTGSITGTGEYSTGEYNKIGGVVGWNFIEGDVSNCYNTGAVSGCGEVGGITGSNTSDGVTQNSYNTGLVSLALYEAQQYAGGVVGYNDAMVSACAWLERTNLKNSLGIGHDTKSQTTTTFTSEGTTLADVYASMSAIATSADGATVGGIIALDFTHVDGYIQIPTTFNALQGSYYVESNDPGNEIVGTISDADTSIKFCTGASLEAALNGDFTNAEVSGDDFTINVSGDIWIIIKSINSQDSSLNRNYAFYRITD